MRVNHSCLRRLSMVVTDATASPVRSSDETIEISCGITWTYIANLDMNAILCGLYKAELSGKIL